MCVKRKTPIRFDSGADATTEKFLKSKIDVGSKEHNGNRERDN